MGILRNKIISQFVQVPNALVTDTRVSMSARLVYVYLASKPDGWTVRNDDVKKSLGIKDDSTLAKYWKELISAGWILRRKCLPGENAGTYEYELEYGPNGGNQPKMEISQKWESAKHGKTPEYNNTDSNSNTDLRSNNYIYTPPEETDPEPPKPVMLELKQRINTLFHRKEITAWSAKETAQLKDIAQRPGVLDEMTEIEQLYNSGYEYRRRGIQAFLNNWTTELDKSRNDQYSGNTTREINYVPTMF